MLSMVRKLVKLAIVLLVANAIYQFVPPYIHYVQFKDAVRETAIFSKDVSDQALLESLTALAQEYQVPVDPETIEIRHEAAHIFIDASYVQVIKFAPTYEYPWQFEVKADALQVQGGGRRPAR